MYGKRVTFRRSGGNIILVIPADLCRGIGLKMDTEADLIYQEQKIIVDLTTVQRSRLFDPETDVQVEQEEEPTAA
jgi:hypothetical protein